MDINYLRISVTDRCNLRCFYCMPEEGINLKKHADIMSYEDIYKVTKIFSILGIKKVRITGGEPLVRLGLEDLIADLSSIEGINEISMTTNGVLLGKKAKLLKENGLDRVNISLDTLNRSQYKQITGRDELRQIIKSIDKAKKIGLNPVKLNAVLIKGYNDDQLDKFIEFMDKKDIILRFIEYMPVGDGKNNENYISVKEIKETLDNNYNLEPTEVKGNGPAIYYKLDGYKGKLGFISPFSHNICSECNRLRLTADGKLRTCLLKEEEHNLYQNKHLLTEEKLKEIFIKAVKNKSPHFGYEKVFEDKNKNMYSIGG